VSQINSQLRELLEQAVGEPPRHIAVPAVRRRVIRRRALETVGAVVGVAAIAVGGSAVAAHFIGAKSGGATPAEAAAAGAPRFYLQVKRDAGPSGSNGVPATVNVPATGGRPVLTLDDELAIRSTATGEVTGSIRCPEPAGWWVDETGIAAMRDRTFIVACMEQPAARNPGTNTTETVLFRVRLTAAGRPAAMSPVPGGHISRVVVDSMAATPDGSEIALAVSPGNGRTNIVVLNTLTGRLRTVWSGTGPAEYGSVSLTSDGKDVVFIRSARCAAPRCPLPAEIVEVSSATRGGSPARVRVIALDVSGLAFATVSPDGSTVAAASVRPGNTLIVQRISARTGRPLRTLYFQSGPGAAVLNFLTADPSGGHLIVSGTISGTTVNGWIHDDRLIPLQPAGPGIYWEAW
jgi:hypothetical protein